MRVARDVLGCRMRCGNDVRPFFGDQLGRVGAIGGGGRETGGVIFNNVSGH